MQVTERGIKYRFKKEALLLQLLGTIAGTLAIANYLGITINDVKNLNYTQLVKLLPASILSGIATNHLIARTIRFANPIRGQNVKMVNDVWKKRRTSRKTYKKVSRKGYKKVSRRRSRK